MEGTMEISYVVLCANDTQLSVSLDDLLANEKVARTIRGEFASPKGSATSRSSLRAMPGSRSKQPKPSTPSPLPKTILPIW